MTRLSLALATAGLLSLVPAAAQMRLKNLSDAFQGLVERVDLSVVQVLTRAWGPASDEPGLYSPRNCKTTERRCGLVRCS